MGTATDNCVFLHSEMQQDQPQLYDTLTKDLSPEEQQIVQSVIIQAETIRVAAASGASKANGNLQ